MSKVDDELTRRLRRAERPVDGDAVFEVLERRRSHRERVRRVQAALLAFAVLTATAGGFLFLRDAFDPDKRNVGDELTPAIANGEIVFSRSLPDGSEHLFAVQPGVFGERLITSGSATYADPSVAPDGRTIAVVHSIPSFGDMNAEGVIATVTMDGGEPTWITDPLARVGDPSWSPDGTQIAFAGIETGQPPSGIFVMNADGSSLRLAVAIDGVDLSAPDWSPDGQKLVFAGLAGATSEREPKYSDLFMIGIDGSGLTNLTESPAISESTPSWSPDGDLIAYRRNEGNTSDTIQLIDTSGRPAGTVCDDPDAGEIGEIDWSPDGRLIAFTSSLALTGTDTNGDLDVLTVSVGGSQLELANLTTEGASGISWQPLPAGSEPQPSPTSEPTESPRAEPAVRDVGMGFLVCQVSEIEAQLDGEGAADTAIVATRLGVGGRCPSFVDEAQAYVGVDLNDDGRVDTAYGPISCEAYYCRVFAAPDLDGDGDRHELLVVESAGSIVGLGVYALEAIGSPTSGTTAIVRIEIGEPDDPEMGFVTGEPARLFIGGDEGWSYRVRCEDQGGNRFLSVSRAYHAIDESGPWTVDGTTLSYADLRLNVVDAREPELSMSDDPLGPQPEDLCGAPIPKV